MTLTGDILIKDGTVIQPEVDFCGKADVLISDGCIKAVLKHGEPAKASKTFHADNCIVTPGLIDFCFSSSIFPHFRHSTSPLSSWEIPHFQQALSGYRFHNCVLPHKGMFHSVASSTSHQEMAVVSQSVNHGSGHLFIGEDAAPF